MKHNILYFALAIFSASLQCCTPKDTVQAIVTGETIDVQTQDMPVTGGEIKINKPGDPLNQLTINIPSNAFTTARKFDISYTAIKGHSLGEYFHPLTPLINIKNGGGYADSLITLTIPVDVPEGHFAMAFFYNNKTGQLEGMPLITSDNNKVVVATRTFDLSGNKKNEVGSPIGQMQQQASNNDGTSIVVSSTEKKNLERDFDTGFRPGIDDCPMPNSGSMYAPKGICSGESVAMLWYYTEKRSKGASPLFKLLDNDGGRSTPNFWQDDSKGLKLASILQYDYSYGVAYHVIVDLGQFISQSILPNRMTRYALLYAMIQTKQPQYVGVVNNNMLGHAMVAYMYKDDELYIADPNLPGDTLRRIPYDESTHNFAAYSTGVRGTDGKVITTETYTHLWYLAKNALSAYGTAEDNWKELENGTIGKGKFPDFSIVALNTDNEYAPFTDGFNVPEGLLTINVHGKGTKCNYFLYDAKGKLLDINPNTPVQLPPGEQLVGVHVTDEIGNWAGFKWISVKVGGDALKPTGPMSGEPRFTYRVNGVSFTADTGFFKIEGKHIRLYCPKYVDAFANNLNFSSVQFSGVGTYNDVYGTLNEASNDMNQFTTAGTPGTLTITQWSGGRLDGTFSFTVSDINSKLGTRTIEGEFHFPR